MIGVIDGSPLGNLISILVSFFVTFLISILLYGIRLLHKNSRDISGLKGQNNNIKNDLDKIYRSLNSVESQDMFSNSSSSSEYIYESDNKSKANLDTFGSDIMEEPNRETISMDIEERSNQQILITRSRDSNVFHSQFQLLDAEFDDSFNILSDVRDKFTNLASQKDFALDDFDIEIKSDSNGLMESSTPTFYFVLPEENIGELNCYENTVLDLINDSISAMEIQ